MGTSSGAISDLKGLAEGLSLAGSPLEPPQLVSMGWKVGQSFTAADDPDRMELPWRAPSFLQRKDPKLQCTSWEPLPIPEGPDRLAGVVTLDCSWIGSLDF